MSGIVRVGRERGDVVVQRGLRGGVRRAEPDDLDDAVTVDVTVAGRATMKDVVEPSSSIRSCAVCSTERASRSSRRKLTGFCQAPFRAVLTLASAVLTSVIASCTGADQSERQQLRLLPATIAPTVNSTVAGATGGVSPPQPMSSNPPKSAAPVECVRITSETSAASAIN